MSDLSEFACHLVSRIKKLEKELAELRAKNSESIKVGDVEEKRSGITKREHFAAMAMQGQLASLSPQMIDLYVSQAEDEGLSGTRQLIAENSVRHADALLKTLNEESNNGDE